MKGGFCFCSFLRFYLKNGEGIGGAVTLGAGVQRGPFSEVKHHRKRFFWELFLTIWEPFDMKREKGENLFIFYYFFFYFFPELLRGAAMGPRGRFFGVKHGRRRDVEGCFQYWTAPRYGGKESCRFFGCFFSQIPEGKGAILFWGNALKMPWKNSPVPPVSSER